MQALSSLPNLRTLNLFATKVTDRGIEALQRTRSLRELFAWQTQVTDAGLASFRRARSDLRVVHAPALPAPAEAAPVKRRRR